MPQCLHTFFPCYFDRDVVKIVLFLTCFGVVCDEEASMSQSGEYWGRAIAGLRQSGQQDYLARGLLARAAYYREVGEYEKAQADLDEALEIAEDGAMKLFLVDYHLEAARLCFARKQKEQSHEHKQEAKKLIDETGYKRRLKDLEELN